MAASGHHRRGAAAADIAIGSLALHNPHITAAAPISYDFDPYEDIMRPGGILIQPLIAPYGLLLQILDKADGTTCATSAQTRQLCQALKLTRGPEPTGGPYGKALRAAARAQHFHNANLVQMAQAGIYRDWAHGPQSWTVTSVGSKTAAIATGGVPILTFAGWLDAGTANGVLSEFASLPNTQESWIGPWSHGQGHFADPFQPSRHHMTAAEHQQLNDRVYAFFDRYVKHDGHPADTRAIHYYTLNAAPGTPPPAGRSWAPGRGRVTLDVTGIRGARHGALYAYLEDVQPTGRVTYITEGELALADRAIAPKKARQRPSRLPNQPRPCQPLVRGTPCDQVSNNTGPVRITVTTQLSWEAHMRLLVLGGTAWLGRYITTTAAERGHRVTCLARGESGVPPPGAAFTHADRDGTGAYREVAHEEWHVVIDVSRQPGQVRRATTALAGRAGSFVFVSSTNVYDDHTTPGADENAALLPALAGDVMASMDTYGQAKVACEQHVISGFGPDRSLIARVGLIGGPGDTFDRTGYWPVRFRRPTAGDGSVLVPDVPGLATQVIDVRDLAGWLVDTAEQRLSGVFNVVGETIPLPAHLALAREVASHTGPVVAVGQDWLIAHDVQPWMGERSLPLWLPMPEYAGHARDGSAAKAAGLTTRPLAETLADTLAWELGRNLRRPRHAGLSDHDERRLLRALTAA